MADTKQRERISMDEQDQHKFNIMVNEHNAMSDKLAKSETEAEERKKTIDRLSAELGKYKRKEKRVSNK